MDACLWVLDEECILSHSLVMGLTLKHDSPCRFVQHRKACVEGHFLSCTTRLPSQFMRCSQANPHAFYISCLPTLGIYARRYPLHCVTPATNWNHPILGTFSHFHVAHRALLGAALLGISSWELLPKPCTLLHIDFVFHSVILLLPCVLCGGTRLSAPLSFLGLFIALCASQSLVSLAGHSSLLLRHGVGFAPQDVAYRSSSCLASPTSLDAAHSLSAVNVIEYTMLWSLGSEHMCRHWNCDVALWWALPDSVTACGLSPLSLIGPAIAFQLVHLNGWFGFRLRFALSWTWICGSMDSRWTSAPTQCQWTHCGCCPFTAYRFGEADHPGPSNSDTQTIKVAVVNPTAIYRKESLFLELGADVLALAETSAVSKVQHTFAANLRAAGFQTHFGAPVSAHGRDAETQTALRGLAGGVAIVARLPSRPSPAKCKPPLEFTSRIVEAMVRFGAMEVRCVCLYGVPQSHPEASHLNDILLRSAWERLVQNKIPSLILGDFNVDVCSLPTWSNFEGLGYVEAFRAAKAKFGIELPPTCKQATRFDTALMAPVLTELLTSAQVMVDCHAFDAHSPLMLEFAIPPQLPKLHRWSLPKPWTDFAVPSGAFAEAYSAHSAQVEDVIAHVQTREELTGAFQVWVSAVEGAIGEALKAQTMPGTGSRCVSGLPRAYRGRCRLVQRKARTVTQLSRPARIGDFLPTVEIVSVRCKQRLKQCRRTKTLMRGLRKFLSQPYQEQQMQQLLNEWHAILRAPGYEGGFQGWVLSWDFVLFFPEDFPSLPWLTDLVQLLEFDCQAQAQQEATLRRASYQQATVDDEVHQHSRGGFRSLKPAPRPPFTAVSSEIQQPAVLTPAGPPGEWLCKVHAPFMFRPGEEVSLEGHDGLVVSVLHDAVHVAFSDDCVPTFGDLEQVHHDCTPSELHLGFQSFWRTYWQRDSCREEQQISEWPQFRALLEAYPCPWGSLDLDLEDVDLWIHVCKRMRSSSATGACGFSVRELKSLPRAAYSHLAKLFSVATVVGLPQFLLMGRVNVLAKTVDPQGYNDGRPICVLPVLYRAWTSVCCQAILRKWRDHLPPGLYGGVPGRAARDVTYHLQHKIELSCLEDTPISGVVLDIIKCFNALPRAPIRELLCHMHVPPPIVHAWLEGLHRLGRCSSFVGDVSLPCFSTTGLPEGDGMSVVGAVAVGWLYAQHLCNYGLDPLIFVDNWSWTSEDHTLHPMGLDLTCQFAAAMRIQVDWRKTFGWSRTAEGQKWLRDHIAAFVPEGVHISILGEAKDLGVAMRYRNSRALGSLKSRMLEGRRRLNVLQSQPRSLENKARLIQSAIWPATFYGCENFAIGQKHIHALRAAAARALVGQHRQLAPFLALQSLVPGLHDPEVYVLVAALRALHRALRVDREVALTILGVLDRSTGDPMSVVGPSTALAALLKRNDWSFKQGTFYGPGNFRFCIHTTSTKDFVALICQAWGYRVRSSVLHRNGLHELGVPDPHATHRLLRLCPVSTQKVIARHIVGAFQTAAVKFKWGGASSPNCQWCGQCETHAHRFLDCPVFQDLRSQHAPAVHVLRHERPEWLHCPVATVPDEDDILTLIFHTRPFPAWPLAPPAVSTFNNAPALTFFTDGSCKHPSQPRARHAAWAVVQDATTTEHERRAAIQLWRAAATQSPFFRVVDQGLVPGRQTIARAELCAAVQAVRIGRITAQAPVTIVTDSAYVMYVFAQFRSGKAAEFMSTAANLDILYHLEEAWYDAISTVKVKSHLDPCKVPDDAVWHVLGNQQADVACQSALAMDLSVVTEMTDAVMGYYTKQHMALQQVHEYLVALNAATTVRRNGTTVDQVPSSAHARPQLSEHSPVVQEWIAERMPQLPPFESDVPPWEVFRISSWGVHFAWRAWHWAQTLEWVECSPQRQTHFPGTTTLELLVNFIVVTSSLPPTPYKAAAGGIDYMDFTEPGASLCPVPIRSWLQSLLAVIQQLGTLTRTHLFPPTHSAKVSSLLAWGEIHPRSGFRTTCRMTRTRDTAQLLLQVLDQVGVLPLRSFAFSHRSNTWQPPQELLVMDVFPPELRKRRRRCHQ